MGTSLLDIPTVVRRFDSNLQTIVSSAWARRLREQWWKRIVKTRSSTTGTDIIQWLLETAKLRDMGQGGRNVYSDMMAANLSITNKEIGEDLKLKAIEILNAMGGQNGAERNALDFAAHWGRQVGAQGSDWPQLQAALFMTGQITVTAYDGLPFFNEAHWVNPATKAGATFTNVFYGMPFDADNYAAIGAYIETIPGPDGRSRKIKPRIVATGSDNRYSGLQLFQAASFTDPKNGSKAAADNVTKSLYDTEAPIADADLSMTGADKGTWWIAAELQEDDQLAGMIFQERIPFTLKSYTDFSDVQLAREEAFEWKFRGWNQFSAGHPFLLFKCVPYVPAGKSQWTPP